MHLSHTRLLRILDAPLASGFIASAIYVTSFSEASVEHFFPTHPHLENGLVRKELVLVNHGVEHLDR